MRILFQSIVPEWEGEAKPSFFPLHIRWGFQASLFFVTVFSFFYFLRPFFLLSSANRELLIQKLYSHRWGFVRNLVQWWKLMAIVTNRNAEWYRS